MRTRTLQARTASGEHRNVHIDAHPEGAALVTLYFCGAGMTATADEVIFEIRKSKMLEGDDGICSIGFGELILFLLREDLINAIHYVTTEAGGT